MPYISAVFGRTAGTDEPYRDIRISTLEATKGDRQDIVIAASGFTSTHVTYQITQDKKHQITNSMNAMSDLNLFSELGNDAVYAYAFERDNEDIKTAMQEIKIERLDPDAAIPSEFKSGEYCRYYSHHGKCADLPGSI